MILLFLYDLIEMQSICQDYKQSFVVMSTEYRRIQYFTTRQYVAPQLYIMGHDIELNINDSRQFISLRRTLELIFLIPNALENILSYMLSLTNVSDRIYNYVETDRWKQKLSLYELDHIVLPLIFYFDDIESNNPLGPKKDKLGVIYVSLIYLSPECQFTSDNIYLALIFKSVNRKVYSNKKTFAPLIEEFNSLANEGIVVKLRGTHT